DYKQQKHVGPQVLMGTTNWLPIPSQPFAISFGTSGCTNDKKFWAEEKAKVFAQISFDNLSQEMAQGQGEHLASLATLMGVPADHQAEFFAMTQEQYTSRSEERRVGKEGMAEALQEAVKHNLVRGELARSR